MHMKTNLNLSIPSPCGQKWQAFIPTPDGGFCSSCNKVVVDFTGMNDEQIVDFFKNKPAHTCGRFRPDQIRTYTPKVLPK